MKRSGKRLKWTTMHEVHRIEQVSIFGSWYAKLRKKSVVKGLKRLKYLWQNDTRGERGDTNRTSWGIVCTFLWQWWCARRRLVSIFPPPVLIWSCKRVCLVSLKDWRALYKRKSFAQEVQVREELWTTGKSQWVCACCLKWHLGTMV